jgi:iron complex transport system permease protein
LLGGLAGLGLAVAGVAWQGVLRNPLADPYLIGASAGGALGAALAIAFGVGGPGAVPLLAFAGALAAVAVVYRLALVGARALQTERLLLAGVAVSSFLSALLSLVLVSKSESFSQLYFWLVGGLSGRGWEQLWLALPYVGAAIAGVVYYTPRLNLLQLGEDTAAGLGVDVARDQQRVIALAALLTASIVAVCGMIGFLGLVVPHLARLLVGPDLRKVLPTAAVMGGGLLTGADLVARLVWAPIEVPVGILTAMLGAPFFLYLLTRPRA